MDTTERCQSCGMPLGTPGYYGTNADGSENREYCTYCFKNGAFADPDLTLDRMVDASIAFMTNNLGFSRDKAEELSKGTIPQLKRWKAA